MIENRGPQLVQLMNGYRWRRSAGSRISARQSAHTSRSGETRVVAEPVRSVLMMRKPLSEAGAISLVSTCWMMAAGGGEVMRAVMNASMVAAGP